MQILPDIYLLDGFAYALLTAGTFGWLWPDAAA